MAAKLALIEPLREVTGGKLPAHERACHTAAFRWRNGEGMDSTVYEGNERRKHRMFVTRNTEYHFRERTCIAVRDRRSGKWLASHLALNRRLSGAIRFCNGALLPCLADPTIGDALYFGDDGQELVTSLLCEIARPEKAVVRRYAKLAIGA